MAKLPARRKNARSKRAPRASAAKPHDGKAPMFLVAPPGARTRDCGRIVTDSASTRRQAARLNEAPGSVWGRGNRKMEITHQLVPIMRSLNADQDIPDTGWEMGNLCNFRAVEAEVRVQPHLSDRSLNAT